MIKATLLLACSLGLCGLAHAAPSERSAQSPQTYEKSVLGLAGALSEGQSRACSPVSLTVAGRAQSGKRFFASANLDEFPRAARESSRSGAKLTPAQSRSLDHLTRLAVSAAKNGQGFPASVIANAERETGFHISARVLCLTEETVGSRP